MSAQRRFAEGIARLGLTGRDVLATSGRTVVRGGRDNALISCPFHDEDTPSFSVHLPTGRGHCFACDAKVGDVVALHKALGRFATMGDALRDLEGMRGVAPRPLVFRGAPRKARNSAERPVGVATEVRRWTYRRADGSAAFDVARIQFRLADGSFEIDDTKNKVRKEYRPAPPGTSRWGMPAGFDKPGSRPLFELPRLLASPPSAEVFVVEGEPAAVVLAEIGSVAVTSSGGASSPHRTDWAPLAGRRVVIWPDNDEAGFAYAEAVAALLRDSAPGIVVSWVDVAKLGLPSGGDAVDWLTRREGGGS
jgi:hypothetical protein